MTVKVEHLTGGYGKRPVIEDINFELMLFMEVPYDSKVEHLTGGYGKRPVIEDINFELKAGKLLV